MKSNRIIINADDCGYSNYVNSEIERAIIEGRITSTTIMANMSDFDGAIELYKKYSTSISFGWHINLTEGRPLTYSQILLDKGFFKETSEGIVFNGLEFWKKNPSREMYNDIKKELICQYEKIKDSGVCISHVDSHQHIHTCPGLYLLFPSLLRELGIQKCRRLRNNVPSLVNRTIRTLWAIPFRARGIKMTDYFCSFKDFYLHSSIPQGKTVELMKEKNTQFLLMKYINSGLE